MLTCASVYLVLVAILFCLQMRGAGGHFTYALDDPYIHLALAENLRHGHYGINPTEITSPSSSVLWPFLLIPFAGTAFHAFMPLCWNIVFGVTSACLIGWTVSRWFPEDGKHGRMPEWQRWLIALLLMVVANLVSLTLVGLEHVLQVLLAICCAIGMIEALAGRRIPGWCIAAAVIAPSVRYEGISLTLAMCFALIGLRQSKKAAAVLALSLLPLAALSLYFRVKGIPLLPMSITVKGNTYISANVSTPLLSRVLTVVRHSVVMDLTSPGRFSTVVLFLIFAGLTRYAESRQRRSIYGGVTLVAALQLTFGQFGWFHRYEVYALIFLTIVCVDEISRHGRFVFGNLALSLVFIASPFIVATEMTVPAALEVYRQQYQMHRFVRDFYHGNYAVNDLGWTSFQRSPDRYVLDIYGLASVEASKQANRSPAWLESMTHRYNIGLAMIYPTWFKHIPSQWKPLAEMCLPSDPIAVSKPCVVFYSTAPEREEELRRNLMAFGPTLPPKVVFQLDSAAAPFAADKVLTTEASSQQDR